MRYLLSIILVVLMTGCKKSEQIASENQAIADISRMLKVFDAEHTPTQVTNLFQLFSAAKKDYPQLWHNELIALGRHAGFSNSVFEKYTFFPPGATNRLFEGELVLMNARPFPDRKNVPGRFFLSRVDGSYQNIRCRWFPERSVQRILDEVAVKPFPMPKAFLPELQPGPVSRPPTPPLTIKSMFGEVAERIGLGKEHWFTALGAVLIVALALTVIVILLYSTRSHAAKTTRQWWRGI